MLLLTPILLLGFSWATASPSQLRLSHSGYEIISFNEQAHDDRASPLITKQSTRNSTVYTRIGLLNLEKASDSSDDTDEIIIESSNPKNHHRQSQRARSGSSRITEIRHNMIDLPSKESTISPKHASLYLSVGSPKRPYNLENLKKESANSLTSADGAESIFRSSGIFVEPRNHREQVNQEKIIGARIESKIKGKKSGLMVRSKLDSSTIDSDGEYRKDSEKPPKIHESVQESGINLNKIRALVIDANLGLDFLVGRSANEEKLSRIEALSTKSGISKIPKISSLRIHDPRNFWLPARNSAMYSPIYPSGFDMLVSDKRQKSIFPFAIPTSNNYQRFDSRTPSERINNDEIEGEARRHLHESREIGSSGMRDVLRSLKTNPRTPSFLVLKRTSKIIKDDPLNLGDINEMSVDLADIVPFDAGTSLNILPVGAKNQRHGETNYVSVIGQHIEHGHHPSDSLILPQRDHSADSDSLIRIGKMKTRDDDIDSKINHRISKTGWKGDNAKSNVEKLNITNSHTGVLVDILHEIAPDDYESTYVDLDSTRSQDFNVPKNKCKRMKSLTVPAYYQFLTKFTDAVLENALQYETSLQISDNASKLLEIGKKKITDDEIQRSI